MFKWGKQRRNSRNQFNNSQLNIRYINGFPFSREELIEAIDWLFKIESSQLISERKIQSDIAEILNAIARAEAFAISSTFGSTIAGKSHLAFGVTYVRESYTPFSNLMQSLVKISK